MSACAASRVSKRLRGYPPPGFGAFERAAGIGPAATRDRQDRGGLRRLGAGMPVMQAAHPVEPDPLLLAELLEPPRPVVVHFGELLLVPHTRYPYHWRLHWPSE